MPVAHSAAPRKPTPGQTSIAATRMVVGQLQGLALYGLYRSATVHGPLASQSFGFVPLVLLALLLPLLLNTGLGHLNRRRATYWCLLAAALLTGLGMYDVWRDGAGAELWSQPLPAPGGAVRYPQAGLLVAVFAGFFVAQALVMASAQDHRGIARYSSYFEVAWKLLVQLQFSVLFVLAVWLVLWLCASLFGLVGLDAPQQLIEAPWFAIPVTMFALSFALHITDVRPAMVGGMRTLLLNLLSWILPLATLSVGAFLLALPWTGLAPLWGTGRATAVLLGAAATLVLLINAAIQDGRLGSQLHPLLRWSARAAALWLLPLVLLAVYAMGLRVVDYGWTVQRIQGAACISVAANYAIGYAWAALHPTHWMHWLARVNVVNALAILAVLLALFSPLADPARLAVSSQYARLESGRVNPAQFDFDSLRSDGKRYGRQALERLRSAEFGDAPTLMRQGAAQALERAQGAAPRVRRLGSKELAAQLHVWPAGAVLPASFFRQDWSTLRGAADLPQCLRYADSTCDVYVNTNHNGKRHNGEPALLVVGRKPYSGAALLRERASGEWEFMGRLVPQVAGCTVLRQQLQDANSWHLAPAKRQDLLIGQQRLALLAPDELPADCTDPAP